MTVEHDIIPNGRKIADSWWGRAWCTNLESYADYSNRLPRGRTYLRDGAVKEIDIEEGRVTAKVRGSRPKPYRVSVDITPLPEFREQAITDRCGRRINNLDSLLSGNIPPDIADMFVSEGGLFPSPREIIFHCSCPDSAYLCKHVAAVLYGIGVVFDREPLLFFRLRGLDVDSLIQRSVEERTELMLKNADKRTSRTLDDDAVSLFGILRSAEE